MYRFFYSVIFYAAMPFVLIRLLARSIRTPEYRHRIGERLALNIPPGKFDQDKQTIWIHAVSVGETAAAAPLVFELQREHPEVQIVITTMTATGSDRVCTLFGDTVFHRYIPYDLPGAINRFLDKLKPSLLILMETELWPNLIYACHQRKIKIILANARLSEKSARGYARFTAFTKNLLGKFDTIAAQSQADAERFIKLGAASANVKITGSLKFNIKAGSAEDSKQPYFAAIKSSDRPILIAASTREGEEEKLLAAFEQCQRVVPSLLLLLVPRHPQRFSKVARLCEDRGFKTTKRSEDKPPGAEVQILLGDSMGEMSDYYGIADIAFVGGSLVNTGCQNVLEPAAMAIPIITGPSQYNFATICKQLEAVAALKTVQDEAELAEYLLLLLADRNARREMGLRGKELVAANQNALPALLQIINPLIQTDV